MTEISPEVEKHARALAMWHGQKIVRAGQTLAALTGYGSWENSADKYADAHWREYTAAAEYVLEQVEEAVDQAYYNARCEGSERA